MKVESAPGIHVSKRGLADVLPELSRPLIQLHEDGKPVVDLAPSLAPTFVLSDYREFTDRGGDGARGRRRRAGHH